MIQKNFIQLYEESFSKNFDLPALSDYTSDISYTYGDMARQIARLHILYEAAGVKKGDKVAVFGKNSSNWCVGFMSIITYGGVAVPILSDFKPADAHTIITHSDAVMLLVDTVTMETLSVDEMKAVKIILSLDDWEILSGKSKPAFKKAHRELDELFYKKFNKGFGPEQVKYAEVDNSASSGLADKLGSREPPSTGAQARRPPV